MNILTDVMVMALPIPSILRLQLSTKSKVMLCCMFLLGGFVTVTSILRTTSVQNSIKNQQDLTYNFIDRGIWTLTEANLGIVTACLLVLKQPLTRLLPRVFPSTKKGSSYIPDNTQGRTVGYYLSDLSTEEAAAEVWRGPVRNHPVGVRLPNARCDEDVMQKFKSRDGSDQDILAGSRMRTETGHV
ncbi:hypothetical protein JDV02_005587 [Purpureocillium takamizusanense]|uniref:Rhodopsin domain-containing protein n=1 Tax=Purpureocillium takamizusanense TaxID=2060973 RepID=A0A9Q8QGE2_9HYPO|nr:uncharacterized protein JDV02_005587 [Purpureocillium takamizusanense]UNI19403.1 hypothetical protein JDV02_005587 [Purpureocillium takamizusanense]